MIYYSQHTKELIEFLQKIIEFTQKIRMFFEMIQNFRIIVKLCDWSAFIIEFA